jgi:8-oxo-dGTP diphosphatase
MTELIDHKIFDQKRNFHGAKGLVFIDNKILVYRRDGRTTSYPFFLDLPGGGREGNESPFETFQRETKEEFGVTVESKDITYSKQYVSTMDPTMEAYFIVVRPSKLTSQHIVPSFEVPEPLFMTLDEFVSHTDIIPRHRDRIKEYLQKLES